MSMLLTFKKYIIFKVNNEMDLTEDENHILASFTNSVNKTIRKNIDQVC